MFRIIVSVCLDLHVSHKLETLVKILLILTNLVKLSEVQVFNCEVEIGPLVN
jgi:hypothetical protein